MAKKTLLDIVQNILSSMDADEVNSINDTIEALQVAEVVKVAYEAMSDNRNWIHKQKLTTLDGISDTTKPSHMRLSDDVKELTRVSYNIRELVDIQDKFTKILPATPERFLDIVNSRDSSRTDVQTVTDFDGGKLFILNDEAPTMWTSFDDVHVIFDAFDNEVDTTMQTDKSQILAFFDPAPFVLSDSFVPDFPSEAFTALQAEAKSIASLELNQIVNDKAEQTSRRAQAWLSQKSFKVFGGVKYRTNYGRKGRSREKPLLDLSSTSTRSNN